MTTTPATTTSDVPSIPQMITKAITALGNKEGSTMKEILEYLTLGSQKEANEAVFTNELKTMVESGDLVLKGDSYCIRSSSSGAADADPDVVPVKRGRGRPPKGSNYVSPPPVVKAVSAGPTRGRGRPPKVKEVADEEEEEDSVVHVAPVSGNVDTVEGSAKRGRGRPAKKAKTDAPVVKEKVVSSGSPKRGRGRPPKVAAVGI